MYSLLSIVIPTRDRGALLLRAVDALLDQTTDAGAQVEVIVVDDGSAEDIKAPLMAVAARREQADRLRYLFQPRKGPAAARNLGIREARGELVLFLGDDIVACPGLLREHVRAHTLEYPGQEFAVLGLADLAPQFCQTRFALWWRRWNFRYWLLLEGRRSPDYSFFYTSNLSLKRGFLLQNGMFDEEFRYAAYEDSELGYRLARRGLELVFKPQANAYHWHEICLRSACQRMRTRGEAHDLFVQKTGMLGISRIWMALGSGPWMHPVVIRRLFGLANWLQPTWATELISIAVLMYWFQVGRGKYPPLHGLL